MISDTLDTKEAHTSQAMAISLAALGHATSSTTLQLLVDVQGHQMLFLVDPGSTHSFSGY